MAKKDPVDSFLRLLLQELPGTSSDVVQSMERQLRTEWGGREVWISRRVSDQKAKHLGSTLVSSTSVDQAIKSAGVPRSTGFRLLKRRLSWP